MALRARGHRRGPVCEDPHVNAVMPRGEEMAAWAQCLGSFQNLESVKQTQTTPL